MNFCIRGAGESIIDGTEIRYAQYDVFNTPSWSVYEHQNNTNELQVRLTYSNAPLLEKMKVHIVDHEPKVGGKKKTFGSEHAGGASPYGTFPISDDGACLMPYEKLINPDVVEQRPLHFPWSRVEKELAKLASLGHT